MSNSRPFAGDSQKLPDASKGKPQTLKCPACGGIITIKAVGMTVSAICTYCSSVIDVANGNFQIIKKANEKTRKTLLELGVRGDLFGAEWEVIGYTEKRDGDYSWEEYLLYNPYYGFRFLVQAGGHWNFVKVLKNDIPGAGDENDIWLKGKKYELFLKGEAVVDYVKGEFYWRVKKGERTNVADYVAPPSLLSAEINSEEITVSLGEYLKPEAVSFAFKLDQAMPPRAGVASNQPAPFQGSFLALWIIAGIFIAIATMAQNITVKSADNANVYSSRFLVDFADRDKTISSLSFFVPKKSNVLICSNSPLDNEWLELHMSLMNEQTDAEYPIVQALEFYHGVDSDGAWSEGRQETQTYISSVPSGNYRLLVDVDSGTYVTYRKTPANFFLSIRCDVPAGSNYWITALMILLFPGLITMLRWSFESKRWAESDYKPAIYDLKREYGDEQ